jgi:SNF2 family DNA or RNA helicase
VLFRDHIIQDNHEYMLPNGEVLILPDEWFSRYRQLMIHAVHDKKTISLRKHHFPLVASFLNSEVEELQQSLASTGNFPVPELTGISLRTYQLAGYFWLKNLAKQGFGGILADDMGLGKTIQMIAVLAGFHPEKEFIPYTGPGSREYQLDLFSSAPVQEIQPGDRPNPVPASLVVMPSSLVHNWSNEFRRLAPHLRILCYTGLNRQISEAITFRYDVILTTYGILRNDISQLGGLSFSYLILDESQNIKNPASRTAQAAFHLKGSHRVTLTGTPIENSLSDLWSQMHFANPGLLGSHQLFMKMYDIFIKS